MTFLMLFAAGLSSLALSAHFYRHENIFFTLAYFALFLLLFWRRPWVSRLVQAGLIIGVVEWVRTALGILHDRQAAGTPYLTAMIILGAVAAFTLFSAMLFETGRLQRHYGLIGGEKAG